MKQIILLALIISMLYLYSCKKFVEISPPKNQLVNEQVFTDSMNATSAILGIYINMMPNFTAQISNGGLNIYTGLSSDELYTTSNNTDENGFYNNVIASSNSINKNLWHLAYNNVYNINAAIKGLEQSQTLTPQVKNELLGEAKFARAFIYFSLVNLYGEVPLIVGIDYNINRILGRSSVDSIYKLIVNDLIEAQNSLPINYLTTRRFRPNKHSANALLSRVYLYLEDWSKAENTANLIINAGNYSLEADLNNVYKANTNESIWELQVLYPTVETWDGYNFIPTSSTRRPKYSITQNLLSSFEVGDQRKSSWLKANVINSETYYFPYKYKVRNVNDIRQETFIVFRLAEQFLIRAEARAWQNKFGEALSDLNIIRTRAQLPIISDTISKEDLLKKIHQERRIELFSEWGHRWLDLKRTGQADLILKQIKGSNWQSTDVLYPIPQTELNNNPFLIQNPGY